MKLDFLHSIAQEYSHIINVCKPECSGNQCIIWPSDSRAVILEYNEPDATLLIVVPTSVSPSECNTTQLIALLSDGYLGKGLGGSAIGLDTTTQLFVLWRTISKTALELNNLANYIELTINAAERIENS